MIGPTLAQERSVAIGNCRQSADVASLLRLLRAERETLKEKLVSAGHEDCLRWQGAITVMDGLIFDLTVVRKPDGSAHSE